MAWHQRLSIALIVLVLGFCIYRARTQSFTVDEAWVYHSFVAPELSQMARQYDACNHVLHTVLMKLARSKFGGGELALRAPSLIAALVYCIAAYRLTSLLLTGAAQFLCLALLILNPRLVDFFVAARGYGLAIALFLWAIYCAILYATRGFDSKWLRWTGVLAGLSITANLTMLVPVGALGLTLMLFEMRNGWRGVFGVIDRYGGPAVVTAFLILVIPLLPASGENFYYGASTLAESVDSLAASFFKVDGRWPVEYPWIINALRVVTALVMLAAATVFVRSLLRWLRSKNMEWRLSPAILIPGTLVFSGIAAIAAHALAGVMYPFGRTGLYFVPLAILSLFVVIPNTRLRTALNVCAALFVFICISHNDPRFFYEWRYDAGTRTLLRSMEADYAAQHHDPDDDPVTLGTNQFIVDTVRWYRNRRHMEWFEAPEREPLDKRPYDYYLLTFAEDKELINKLGLDVLAEDKLSGEVLARRRK